MTFEDKMMALNECENDSISLDEQFLTLQELSSDEDEFIRSRVASLLVNFVNEESMEILLTLSKDKDELVRTEAYDSLAAFPFHLVEKTLKNAIQLECDDLSRSYAILSWADVISSLDHSLELQMSFIKKCKSTEKSKRCLLSFHYAEYVLGNERVLKEILDFLKDEDYRIRCSTISLLQDIISDSNRQRLIDAIQSLLSTEKSLAVKERIVKFFEYVNVETIFQCRGDSESE